MTPEDIAAWMQSVERRVEQWERQQKEREARLLAERQAAAVRPQPSKQHAALLEKQMLRRYRLELGQQFGLRPAKR